MPQTLEQLVAANNISADELAKEQTRTQGSGINPDALVGNILSNRPKAPPAPPSGGLPGVVGSSQNVVNEERNLASSVAGLAVPTLAEQSARDASKAITDEIDKQTTALEQRRKDEIANIQAQYEGARNATVEAQKRDTGTTNVALQRVGGYLGTQISGVGVLNNLAQTQRTELASLDSKRAAAINAANNAITDKQFNLALAKREEIKSLDAEIDKRRNTFFEQSMMLLNANRDGFDKTISALAAGDTTPSDSSFSALDKLNEYADGVSKGAFLLAREEIGAKKTRTDLENFNALTDVISKLRPDQQITVNGKVYSGTMSENEFKGYEINKSTGDIATITYNKRTGATSVVNQKGVLTPNIDYSIQSVKNSDGSTSLWYVDPTGKAPAVPVLGSQNGGAQGVNLGILQQAFPAGVKPAGTEHGWCVEFINTLINNDFPAGTLNTIDQKRAAVDPSITIPSVGDLVFTNEDATHGHIALINSLRTDPQTGKLIAVLTESNFNTDGQGNGVVGHTRTLDIDPRNLASVGGKVLGFAKTSLRPELGSQLVQLGDGAKGGGNLAFSDTALSDVFAMIGPKQGGEADTNLWGAALKAAADSGDMSRIREVVRTGIVNTFPAADQSQIAGRFQTVEALSSIKDDIAAFKAAGGNIGLLKGSAESIANRLGQVTDPKVVDIATKLQSTLMNYRRSMTGAAFAESETAEYNKIFPTTKGSIDLANIRIDALVKMMNQSNESAYSFKIGKENYKRIFDYDKKPVMSVGTPTTVDNAYLDSLR